MHVWLHDKHTCRGLTCPLGHQDMNLERETTHPASQHPYTPLPHPIWAVLLWAQTQEHAQGTGEDLDIQYICG